VIEPVDGGQRCEQHVGEVFPPRCVDCDLAAAAYFETVGVPREIAGTEWAVPAEETDEWGGDE
jgi:hypothetical protein